MASGSLALRRGGALSSRSASWVLGQLASFEALLLVAVYSNQIEILLPFFPIDATLLFTALSIPVGLWVLAHEGVYLRGLPSLTVGILFLAWLATTYAWTPSRTIAPKTLAYLATFGLWFLFVGTTLLAGNRERALRFVLLHLPLALILSLYGFYVYLAYGSFRLSGAFGEDSGRVYLSWGYMVSGGGAVAFALAILARTGSRRQFVALGSWGLCLAFLLVGGGRGPLLSNLTVCLLPLLVKAPLPVRGRLLISHAQLAVLLIILVASMVVVSLVVSDQTTTTLGRLIRLFGDLSDNHDGSSVRMGADRFFYFSAAYDLWMQAPIIGHGISSWSVLMYGAERTSSYPHNIFLQIMCETGMVGLILFLFFLLVSVCRLSLTCLRVDPLLLCILLLAPTALLAAMVSGDIAGNRRLFLLFGLLALRPAPAARLQLTK